MVYSYGWRVLWPKYMLMIPNTSLQIQNSYILYRFSTEIESGQEFCPLFRFFFIYFHHLNIDQPIGLEMQSMDFVMTAGMERLTKRIKMRGF